MQPIEKKPQICFDKVMFLSWTSGFCNPQNAGDMTQAVTTQWYSGSTLGEVWKYCQEDFHTSVGHNAEFWALITKIWKPKHVTGQHIWETKILTDPYSWDERGNTCNFSFTKTWVLKGHVIETGVFLCQRRKKLLKCEEKNRVKSRKLSRTLFQVGLAITTWLLCLSGVHTEGAIPFFLPSNNTAMK